MTLPTSKLKERGFTIVELLIVIIVIGILATLVLIAYSNVQAQARDTKRQGNAASVRDAAAGYKIASTNGVYPPNTVTGTSPNQTSDFATAINTASNYSSGIATISLDANSFNTILGSTTPSSGSPDLIGVTYCPTPGTSTAANGTGVKIAYYSETKAAVQYTYTGTTC